MFAASKSEMRFNHPDWCHNHCIKMSVGKLDVSNRTLIIAGSAASVRITRVATTVDEGWYVDWEVVQSQQEKTNGRIVLSTKRLRVAFGLEQQPVSANHSFLEREYGAEAGVQGRFIRWGEYLNIPCPGTGHDGDPNVSIILSDGIKEAVRKLTEP
jgi:hypothetical protein